MLLSTSSVSFIRLSNTFIFPDPEAAFIITYIENQEFAANLNHVCLFSLLYHHHS